MDKKTFPDKPEEVPGTPKPDVFPEKIPNTPEIPENDPEEAPDIIPEEEPYENPPIEVPPPGEGP